MITIIDYGSGNLGSVVNMLSKIGHKCIVSSDPKIVAQSKKIILPGVGTFDVGMRGIIDRGLFPILNKKALEERVPILGICLGAQLMTRKSEEGVVPGFGWIDADTTKFSFKNIAHNPPLPNIGWRAVAIENVADPFQMNSLRSDWKFYFVHNYHFRAEEKYAWMYSHYDYKFICALRKNNLMSVQFHPEKSHKYGMAFLSKFASLQ